MSLEIVNVLYSGVWGAVTLEALERGVGGREGALLYLSKAFAEAGNNVINFVNVEQGSRVEIGEGRIDFLPLNMTRQYLANIPVDIAIGWEMATCFEDHRILDNIKLKICEMQVCHFSPVEMAATENYCDYVAALSPWHKEFLLHQGLEMEEDKVIVMPNGVDINRYPEPEYRRRFNNGPTFVYSSSPDRGLWHLLEIWPQLRKDFNQASLLVAYGAQKWINYNKWSHGRQGEMAVELERLMKQPGIIDIGIIGQSELAELQIAADAWLYPLDSMNATESGNISAIENAAAGNPLIFTDCDCMATEFGQIGRVVDLPWDADKYYEAVYDVLTDEEYYIHLQEKGRKFAKSRDWFLIAKDWLKLFSKNMS